MRISAKSGKVKFRKPASKRLVVKNRTLKVTLKLTRKQRRAFLRKLRTGKKVKVKLTITPTPSGKKKTVTLTVRRR